MSLLINKDGKQLGPFSLDDARAQVLAGKLSPLDWAWPDGGNDWIPLKDVPGFTLAEKPAPLPAAAVAAAAATTAASAPAANIAAEERELWSGHPSQILNLSIYIFWGLLVAVTAAVVFVFVSDVANPLLWNGIIDGTMALIALVNVAVAYFHLKVVHYTVSTQRVRIVSGFFSKEIQEIELFRVKDTMANQSFLLRLFGLGTITILSGDEKLPRLVLSGVPGALELREQIRTEVMALRQRFGVREVDVM
jgi:membrane protein YdbS with pleckstrin-like domain